MVGNSKLAIRVCASVANHTWALQAVSNEATMQFTRFTYVMSINAVLDIALLPAGAGVQTSQMSNGVDFVVVGPILVLEAAFVTFGAWASQIVVVTQLAGSRSFLDVIQRNLVNGDGRIKPTRSRIPSGRLRFGLRSLSNRYIDVFVG